MLAATDTPETPAQESQNESQNSRAAAFFDVDNTLMRGASLFQVMLALHDKKFFRWRDLAGHAWKQLSFVVVGENTDHLSSVREKALAFIAGHYTEEFSALGEEVYDNKIVRKIWPGTRALAEQHLRAGRRVWLVTGSPVEVATVISDRLGLSGALGTVAEREDGRYTGRLVGEILHAKAKAAAVGRLAAEQNLDLSTCYAYSDSHNDIPMLSMVGHPVAINPDRRLRSYARDHNWPVYDFRAGRRAATAGLRIATLAGALYGGYKGLRKMQGKSTNFPPLL